MPTAITGADLVLSQPNAPATAQFGQTITVSFAVTNLGSRHRDLDLNDQIY